MDETNKILIMKKIFTALLFIALSFSMNAQEAVSRETIKNNPNEIHEYTVQDVAILKSNFNEINDVQAKTLNELYYFKYKNLTSEITGDELENLVESMKARTRAVLGDDLYLKVSENTSLFNRITGAIYLAQ